MKKVTQCLKSKPFTQQIRNKWLTYKTYVIKKSIINKCKTKTNTKINKGGKRYLPWRNLNFKRIWRSFNLKKSKLQAPSPTFVKNKGKYQIEEE
jgi:hypothetical protein